MIALGQRKLVDARPAVWDLLGHMLDEANFASALRSVAEAALQGSDVVLEYEVAGEPRPIEPSTEQGLCRTLQEAIANTVKHARAQHIRVQLAFRKRSVRLMVTDDGCGFVLDPACRSYGGHWGLVGLKERASQLCGTLGVESAPGQGTTVVIRVPYTCSAALPIESAIASL